MNPLKRLVALTLCLPVILFTNAQNYTKGYYKDIFIDGGINLSSRKDLPSARVLGLSKEVFVSAKKSSDYTQEDTLLQTNCFAGSEIDENGVLLYPDGEPRFRLVLVHGGGATRHGKSLGEKGRENFRTFVRNGGSFVGFCAGSFITSLGVRDSALKPIESYLGIWPGYSKNTFLSDSRTGISIEKKSPLLKYYDFGDDRMVDSVYHNNGNFADTEYHWPKGTEILARYDTKGMTGLKKKIQDEPAIWAYKADPYCGRVVPCGSHIENNRSGEKLNLMCAMVQYALEGNGLPTTKGELQNGIERAMTSFTHDNNPAYTRIGDKQYHHFTIQVPKGTQKISLTLKELPEAKDFDLYLLANPGDYAFMDNAKYKQVDFGVGKTLIIKNPKAGILYVSVYCDTTVETEDTPHGTQYTGRTDVLNGVPYYIKGEY